MSLDDLEQAMLNREELHADDPSPQPANRSSVTQGSGWKDRLESVEPSSEVRADLLDLAAWSPVLERFARTVKVAVALTDCDGKVLGPCHNPQPVWEYVHDAARTGDNICYFCLAPGSPCTATRDALKSGSVAMAQESSGLMHVAVPLTLGGQQFGSIIAGRVFSRYPEPLPLERVARIMQVSAQQLWHLAIKQRPLSPATLQVYGELLHTLGHAFLRQLYGAILQRRLAVSNQRFRFLADGVKGYALFTVDDLGRVSSWNSGAERMLGYTESEIVGKEFCRLFTPEDIQSGAPVKLLEQAARAGSVADERLYVRGDGSRILATSTVASIGEGDGREFGNVLCDVTEPRKRQQALHEAEKVESIGHLAGGIAHDFNNLLSPILGHASLMLDDLPALDSARLQLESIVNSTEQAADLIQRLLLYAGKGRFVTTLCDLSALIVKILPQIEAGIPKTVRLELDLAPALPVVEVDASQIQQMVMVLVINGVEALEGKPGTMRISTGATDATEVQGDTSRRSVYVQVQDSGMGMDEATRLRVFEPFFTTKFLGRGLGLAAASGVVRAHRGTMQVESVPGTGSAFKVFFPALDPQLVRPNDNDSSL
jgi:PAS domain S-box-containing protein